MSGAFGITECEPCPNCGADNPLDAQECSDCGVDIVEFREKGPEGPDDG